VLPGGRAILFTETRVSQQVDQSWLAVLDRRDGLVRSLQIPGTHPLYVDGVGLVFWADGALRSTNFSPSQFNVNGEARNILTGITVPFFDISRSGTLVASKGGALRGDVDRLLVWVDRQGHEELIPAPPRPYGFRSLRISPDGEQVVTSLGRSPEVIWVWHFGRRTLTRVTHGPHSALYPLWTPDGRELTFGSGPAGAHSLARAKADGASPAISIASPDGLEQFPLSFTPNGRTLIFRQQAGAGRGGDLFMMPYVDHGTARPLLETPFAEFNAAISPDGRWIAFDSNASGRFEVYVRPFPNVTGGQWQISGTGAAGPVWARSGRELFYIAADGSMMAVEVKAANEFSASLPVKLFDASAYHFPGANPGGVFDVSPDGRRFIMAKDPKATTNDIRLVVTTNWVTHVSEASGQQKR
jgi:serine/threonine-protein kinase